MFRAMSGARGQPTVRTPWPGRGKIATSGISRSDKTFNGRIEKGFDFLGYHFGTDGLSVVKKTIEEFIARAIRLYEQEPEEAWASARLWIMSAAVARMDSGRIADDHPPQGPQHTTTIG